MESSERLDYLSSIGSATYINPEIYHTDSISFQVMRDYTYHCSYRNVFNESSVFYKLETVMFDSYKFPFQVVQSKRDEFLPSGKRNRVIADRPCSDASSQGWDPFGK